MKIYIVSDTHLNHKIALEKGWVTEKKINSFFKQRLQIISPSNILIHLGDVSLGDDLIAHKSITNENMNCILVRGNHDNKSLQWYLDAGWNFVCDRFSLHMYGYEIIFSHVPKRHGAINQINICGHMHFDRLHVTNKICLPPLEIFELETLVKMYNKR